ncbi:MAG: hypothetical protein ACYCRF_12610 [Acidithiobacillus sp.]
MLQSDRKDAETVPDDDVRWTLAFHALRDALIFRRREEDQEPLRLFSMWLAGDRSKTLCDAMRRAAKQLPEKRK